MEEIVQQVFQETVLQLGAVMPVCNACMQEVKTGPAGVQSQAWLSEEREEEERERKSSFPELTVSDSLRRKGSTTFF